MEDRKSISRSGRIWATLAVACAWLAAAPPVSRADWIEPFETTAHPFWTVDEVRIGGYKHSIDGAPGEVGEALNLEVLGGRFAGGYEDKVLDFFLTPRPHVGTTIGFGKTDQFYAGVTWDAKLIGNTFLEASFGGAAHDGPRDDPNAASYGCQVNFRESASLGLALSSEWRLMGTIDHMSNAGLCGQNRGLTNAGIRLGIKF